MERSGGEGDAVMERPSEKEKNQLKLKRSQSRTNKIETKKSKWGARLFKRINSNIKIN